MKRTTKWLALMSRQMVFRQAPPLSTQQGSRCQAGNLSLGNSAAFAVDGAEDDSPTDVLGEDDAVDHPSWSRIW